MAEIIMAPGAEESALAVMEASMIQQNIDEHPEREIDFDKLNTVIGIDATDAETQMTLKFENGTLTVYNGLVENPKILISSDSTTLLTLTNLKIVAGMPWYFDKTGMEVVRKFLTRKLKIKGMMTHMPSLTRFTKVVSVAKV